MDTGGGGNTRENRWTYTESSTALVLGLSSGSNPVVVAASSYTPVPSLGSESVVNRDLLTFPRQGIGTAKKFPRFSRSFDLSLSLSLSFILSLVVCSCSIDFKMDFQRNRSQLVFSGDETIAIELVREQLWKYSTFVFVLMAETKMYFLIDWPYHWPIYRFDSCVSLPVSSCFEYSCNVTSVPPSPPLPPPFSSFSAFFRFLSLKLKVIKVIRFRIISLLHLPVICQSGEFEWLILTIFSR